MLKTNYTKKYFTEQKNCSATELVLGCIKACLPFLNSAFLFFFFFLSALEKLCKKRCFMTQPLPKVN